MKLKIKTETLKDMVARSVKGAGNNKLIPITSLMAIQLKDNKLTLITSDATNYLYIIEDKVPGDEFYVVVQVEQFSKLISKLTCENVELEITGNSLQVKGNGTYMIDIPLDENGEYIHYPDKVAELDTSNAKDYSIHLSTIKTILASCKPSLAVTMEIPVYTNYYVGKDIIATDTSKIACYDVNLFGDDNVLISAELMNLLDVMTEESINVKVTDANIVFTTPNCIVYGYKADGIDEYAVEAIGNLTSQEFPSKCKLNKNALLSILDRISLFVGTYDRNAIRITFAQDGISIESKQSNSVEHLDYVESENFNPFTLLIDIEMLVGQIKANGADVIELQYGLDSSIKLVDGNLVQIIALLEDESE